MSYYENKFDLFDDKEEVIKLLEEAAIRTGCQPSGHILPLALYYNPLATIPDILDLMVSDSDVCAYMAYIGNEPLMPRYLAETDDDSLLPILQARYMSLLKTMSPFDQLLMKEQLVIHKVSLQDSRKVMQFVLRYAARK